MDSCSDSALLETIGAGRDKQAFDALSRRHEKRLYNLAVSLTGNRAAAEDAVQEAFLEIWLCASKFQPQRGSASAWMMRIAANRSLNLARKRRREKAHVNSEERIERVARDSNPSEKAEREELLEALRRAMEKMPLFDRQVLALHFGAGMSQEEAGASLSVSQPAIAMRIEKALTFLRGRLSRGGFAAAAPLIDAAALSEAMSSSHEVPPGLHEHVLGRIFSDGDMALKSMSQRVLSGKSLGIKLAAASAASLALAGMVAWSVSGRTGAGAPPAPSAPAPVAAPPREARAPGEALLNARWSFEDGPAKDLKVLKGAWQWQRGAGAFPGSMATPRREKLEDVTLVLLPAAAPHKPFVVTVTAKPSAASLDLLFRISAHWCEGNDPLPPKQAWIQERSSFSRHDKTSIFFIDDFIFQTIDGTIPSGMKTGAGTLIVAREYPKPYPAAQLCLEARNMNIASIELRGLRPSEIPLEFREPRRLIERWIGSQK